VTAELTCLRATSDILRRLVEVAAREQLLWKPADDRWSICEVLNHLTDVEKLNLGHRVRHMLEEERPHFEDYDPGLRYRDGAYKNDDGLRALEAFCETHEASLSWLERAEPADWERRGLHPDVGEVRLSQVLNLWAFHDLSHIRQVSEILKAVCFWDGMGSRLRASRFGEVSTKPWRSRTLQKYYSVDA